jgi:histidyl-tRNA synthetase
MADKSDKSNKPRARLPRGFGDRGPAEIAATRRMLEVIRAVYERYGFEPVETPAIEFTDALGKFLPDQDRPNEGVFSFQDDDEQWLSLRYDLTAPLARYVAENFDALPKPYRSYREGWVFRNEKPGPGRFRQFMQFDADTVGSASPAADAEICMMAADTMEELGIPRGSYVVKVNNRKVLDGVLETIGLAGEANLGKRLIVLRAIDKLDRLGVEGVKMLLGAGRTDESGDFTKGAELDATKIDKVLGIIDALVQALELGSNASKVLRQRIHETLIELDQLKPSDRRDLFVSGPPRTANLDDEQVARILFFLRTRYFDDSIEVLAHASSIGERAPVKYPWGQESFPSDAMTFSAWGNLVQNSEIGCKGVDELVQIAKIVRASGYGPGRIMFDSSVVRGLEYYTGPVYEVELTFPIEGEDGKPIRFGSVAGGGRYDGLVARFRGEVVPATGFSIGVSRLTAALQHLGKIDTKPEPGPVVVTVFPDVPIAEYQRLVAQLRDAEYAPGKKIRAELYLGSGKFGAQMKYADKRGSPCVVIQGGNEKEKGEVQIKDLILGAEIAGLSKDRDDYLKKQAEAQFAVRESELVDAVKKVLARNSVTWG